MHYEDQYYGHRYPSQGRPEYNGAAYMRAASDTSHSLLRSNKKRQASTRSATMVEDKGPPDLDYRASRFASAVLFLAVLVLVVDASRIIVFSWYTDGSVLKYIYGSLDKIEWAKCGEDGFRSSAKGPPGAAVPSAPPNMTTVTRTYRSMEQKRGVLDAEGENSFKKINDVFATGLYFSYVYISSKLSPEAKADIPKVFVQVAFHASTVACLLFLFIAIFPAIVRNHGTYCLLCFGQLLGLLSVLLGSLAMISSMVKIFFFCLVEIKPEEAVNFDFIPRCSLPRKIYFCAECFSLLVLIACVTMVMCLKVFFCRSLCHCCCTERPPSSTRHGYAYDDEEYLA